MKTVVNLLFCQRINGGFGPSTLYGIIRRQANIYLNLPYRKTLPPPIPQGSLSISEASHGDYRPEHFNIHQKT